MSTDRNNNKEVLDEIRKVNKRLDSIDKHLGNIDKRLDNFDRNYLKTHEKDRERISDLEKVTGI